MNDDINTLNKYAEIICSNPSRLLVFLCTALPICNESKHRFDIIDPLLDSVKAKKSLMQQLLCSIKLAIQGESGNEIFNNIDGNALLAEIDVAIQKTIMNLYTDAGYFTDEASKELNTMLVIAEEVVELFFAPKSQDVRSSSPRP